MAGNHAKGKPSSTVLWRIENIDIWESHVYFNENCRKIYSPAFALKNIGSQEWILSLSTDEDDIPIYESGLDLCLCPARYLKSVSLDCEWSVLNGWDGTTVLTSVVSEVTNNESSHYMHPKLYAEDIFEARMSLFIPNNTLTVRLRVWKINEEFAEEEHVSVVTRILNEASKESLMWRIENFTSLRLGQEVIATICLGGHSFRLMFFLTGSSLYDAHVNFGVVTENVLERDFYVIISLLDKGRRKVRLLKKKHHFTSIACEQTWAVPKLVSRREILERSSDWLCNGDLTFHCVFGNTRLLMHTFIERSYCGPEDLEVVTRSNRIDCQGENPSCPETIISTITEGEVRTIFLLSNVFLKTSQPNTSKTVLRGDFMYVCNEHILSDFELRSGDVTFPVHKNILIVRSLFFRAMFFGNIEGGNSKSFDVSDLDVHTLGKLLTFLYTGTMPDLQWQSALKLYCAADKYQVPSLKQECSFVLLSDITVSNVSEVLELADRHKDQEVTEFVLDFIQNNFDAVIFSDEWEKFLERSCLAGKTMKKIYVRQTMNNLQKAW